MERTFTLNNKDQRIGTLTSNTTKTVNIPSNSRGFLFSFAYSRYLLVMYNATGSGEVDFKEISSVTGITLTASQNAISITNSNGNSPDLFCYTPYGENPTLT